MHEIQRGHHVCSYVALVRYPGKTAFLASSCTMTVIKQATWAETEADALRQATAKIAAIWGRCFPESVFARAACVTCSSPTR